MVQEMKMYLKLCKNMENGFFFLLRFYRFCVDLNQKWQMRFDEVRCNDDQMKAQSNSNKAEAPEGSFLKTLPWFLKEFPQNQLFFICFNCSLPPLIINSLKQNFWSKLS